MAKIFIEESTLTAIGDAIRGKEGTTELVPVNDMATRITNIPSGGGGDIDVEPMVLTGDCRYACSGPLANTCLTLFPDKISTKDITSGNYMFSGNTSIVSIPFSLNFKANSSGVAYMFSSCHNLKHIPNFDPKFSSYADVSNIFSNCYSLEDVPYIYNAIPASVSNMFYYCRSIRNIPDDYFDTWDFSRVKTYNYANASCLFKACWSLRNVPSSLFEKLDTMTATSSYNTLYHSLFESCLALDEILNLPVHTMTLTTGVFTNTFNSCSRLKRLTFKTNEDGTPKTANWKGQTLELSSSLGWLSTNNISSLCNYNSGITADKQVKYLYDADKINVIGDNYNELKDDPDWWTTQEYFSRYNHDSALETINSLPDTSAYLASAGGTNTIKFKGTAGRATDGGAIENLTAEEIAVAAAKGWTVSLV